MPTGPLHDHVINSYEGGRFHQIINECRCMIGEDHVEGDWPDENGQPEQPSEDEFEPESSFAGAEEIWLSSGMDEDYDFR